MTGIARKDQFQSRFNDYYPLLCKIAYRYIQNREECEDVVQESFISVWQRGKDQLSEKEFIAYMVTTVKNNCISFLRKQKYDTVSMEEQPVLRHAIAESDDGEPDGSSSREEMLMVLLRILPEKCREVFIMSKLQGFKYREIASELNISEKTVENHMRKAMQMLREHIQSGSILLISIMLFSILLIV